MPENFVTEILKSLPTPTDPQLVRQGELITRDSLDKNPTVKAELLEVGRAQGLRVLFSKKLKAPLTAEQEQSFDQLLVGLGMEKMQDLLLEKTRAELYALLTAKPAPAAKKATKTKK